MSEFTIRLETSEEIVFSVIAPDGKTIVHQCAGDDYDYHVDAEIAANHYKDKCNLQLYRDKAKAQEKEIEALKAENKGLKEEINNWRVMVGLSPEGNSKQEKPDLSFTAHEDATSNGCVNCGNDWKSLNKEGYCSSCWAVWNS